MENVSVQDIVRATGGMLLYGNSDALLNKIRLDSRQVEAGDLFVPIIGEKVDAHRFLPQVAENGAGAVLTSEQNAKTEEMEKTSCAWIAVDDTKKALQAVGRYLRKRLTLPIVGVTGSVGKTTTREMIAAVTMYTRLRETATARSASRSLCPRSQRRMKSVSWSLE